MIPKNVKRLQAQSRHLRARRVDKHTVVVESVTNPAANHVVTVEFGPDGETIRASCTCPWAMYNGVGCSHVMAALDYLAGLKERSLSFWTSEEDARRQKHRTFRLVADDDERGLWITSRAA